MYIKPHLFILLLAAWITCSNASYTRLRNCTPQGCRLYYDEPTTGYKQFYFRNASPGEPRTVCKSLGIGCTTGTYYNISTALALPSHSISCSAEYLDLSNCTTSTVLVTSAVSCGSCNYAACSTGYTNPNISSFFSGGTAPAANMLEYTYTDKRDIMRTEIDIPLPYAPYLVALSPGNWSYLDCLSPASCRAVCSRYV